MEIKDRTLQRIKDEEFFKKEIDDKELRLLSNSIKDYVSDNLGTDISVSCIWSKSSGLNINFKVRLIFDKQINSEEWRKMKYDFLRVLYKTNFFKTAANQQSKLELKLTMLNKQYADTK